MPDNKTDLFNLSPEELAGMLANEYLRPLPASLTTKEDYDRIGATLTDSANAYAYLSVLAVTAKAKVRAARKAGDKEETDLAVDRKDAVNAVLDAVKMQYNAASRLITWLEKGEEEFRMQKFG